MRAYFIGGHISDELRIKEMKEEDVSQSISIEIEGVLFNLFFLQSIDGCLLYKCDPRYEDVNKKKETSELAKIHRKETLEAKKAQLSLNL